jgi:hypothetical protein
LIVYLGKNARKCLGGPAFSRSNPSHGRSGCSLQVLTHTQKATVLWAFRCHPYREDGSYYIERLKKKIKNRVAGQVTRYNKIL